MVVGDDNEGEIELLFERKEEFLNFFPILGVEVACGLIGHENLRTLDESSGDGDTLTLPPTQLRGVVGQALLKPHSLQEFPGPLLGDGHGVSPNEERHHDIFEGRELHHKVVELEDKPQAFVAKMGQCLVVEAEKVLSLKENSPLGGAVQSSQYMQEGALASTGCPQNAKGLSRVHIEIHTLEDVELSMALCVAALDASG